MGLYDDLMKYGGDLPMFEFLPREAETPFDGCFDMHLGEVAKGETVLNDGKVGIVVQGAGTVSEIGKDGDLRTLKRGDVFGIRIGKDPLATDLAHPTKEHFTATEDAVVVWAEHRIAVAACYLQCWFHARFLKEFHGRLYAQIEEANRAAAEQA